jgi:hypothetical protein
MQVCSVDLLSRSLPIPFLVAFTPV